MAAVGPTRQSRVSMSVSMSLVQGGAAGASAAGTVLGMSSSSFARYYHVSLNRVFIFSLSSPIKTSSCCRSILSSAQHPPRCTARSSHRLWRFRSRLVSFTFHFVGESCKFALHRATTKSQPRRLCVGKALSTINRKPSWKSIRLRCGKSPHEL